MKLGVKIILWTIFMPLLLIFVLLTTLRFEILNPNLLFFSLERHNLYQRIPEVLVSSLPNDPNIKSDEERQAYTQIAGRLDKETIKEVIEPNFTQILDYLDGKAEDINVLIPAQKLGIPGLNSDIKWSLVASRTDGSGSPDRMVAAKGVGTKLYLLWGLVLAILVGIIIGYGQARDRLILVGGIMVTTVSVVLRLGLLFLEKSMTVREPAQALLKLMSGSLLADIVTTWIVFGAALILLGCLYPLVFKTKNRFQSSI